MYNVNKGLLALAVALAVAVPTVAAAEGPQTYQTFVPVTTRQYVPPEPARVQARLIHEDGTPWLSQGAYLAEWLGYGTAYPIIVLKMLTSPYTVTDSTGLLSFEGVKPGVYALLVWDFTGTFIVNEPGTKYTLAVIVNPGDTVVLTDVTMDRNPF